MITDEMVQHAHGRITGANRVKFIDGEAWIPLPDKERTRAALEAAAPMIREQCAVVAESAPNGAYREQKGQCHEAIAAAIRAMTEKA